LSVGDRIINKEHNFIRPGNTTFLENIPIGARIHNLEFFSNRGAQLVRAAGSYSTVVSKLMGWCVVKLKSSELRLLAGKTLATYGSVSNFQYAYKCFRLAGYYRRKGWRPHVRGVAMNPIDHPHGGGQGKTSGGRPSVTPYGKITKGQPTVVKRSKLIISKRKK
jgi:large subunit ribosomal protein L2